MTDMRVHIRNSQSDALHNLRHIGDTYSFEMNIGVLLITLYVKQCQTAIVAIIGYDFRRRR